MPITEREWEQIKVSIEAMSSINIVGDGPMINRHNVLTVISRWREEKSKDPIVPKYDDCEEKEKTDKT